MEIPGDSSGVDEYVNPPKDGTLENKLFITEDDELEVGERSSNANEETDENDDHADGIAISKCVDKVSAKVLSCVSGETDPSFDETALAKALEDSVSLTTSGSEENLLEPRKLSLQYNDIVTDSTWRLDQRHIFILSESGKPIYSRYGDEDKLVTLFGLLQAIVSFVQDGEDSIRGIFIGSTRVVFLLKPPLILVCVTRRAESIPQIHSQLSYFYNQIVSILTAKQLVQIYEKRRNYDLRRLLAGSERLLDNLAQLVEDDPSFLLGAVKCLPMASTVRDAIAQAIIAPLSKVKNVVFAILIANNQLVSCVRMKKCFMHPIDLHIILNLIDSSESFKTAESWTPLCLPRFDSAGFVCAHVSYLSDECQACLVLLTTDRDSFFTLSEAKQKIVERLKKSSCLEAINASMNNKWPTMAFVNVPEVRHFLYKSRANAQFMAPILESPYTDEKTEDEKLRQGHSVTPQLKRIYSQYFRLHERLHSHSRPLRIIYAVDNTENWLAWLTSNFEMYVTLEPFVKKVAAIAAVNKLLKFVKKEEDRLFILNSPTF